MQNDRFRGLWRMYVNIEKKLNNKKYNSMKKTVLILFIITGQISNGQFWNIKEKVYGNKHVITETRKMTNYDKLSVTGPYQVKIVSGNSHEVKITADENLMQAIDIYVKAGRLVVRTHPDFDIKKYSRLDIEVPAEYLSNIKLTGSGEIYGSFIFDWNNLKLNITGSGNIDFETNMKHISASVTGSGEIELQGKTDDLKINITGSGSIDATNLETTDAEVHITGSGDAFVSVRQNLNIKILGTGKLYYYGEPEYLKSKSLGSGEVIFRQK